MLSEAFKNRNFRLGFLITGVIMVTALVSIFYTPFDPTVMDSRVRLQPPQKGHFFGTDQYGRDILSRVMKGTINSLLVGMVALGIGLVFGVPMGLVAAHAKGWVDEIFMRLGDLLYGFPAVLSAILITSVFGPGILISMVAIGIFNIPIFARITRGSAMAVLQRDFITAARAIGCGDFNIMLRHVIPNISSPLIVQATVQFAVAILAEAGLSYLGLGTQPPQPSWGQMLNEAQTFMSISPWMAIFPGLAIGLAVLGFNLLGDGLRDTLDPKLAYLRS